MRHLVWGNFIVTLLLLSPVPGASLRELSVKKNTWVVDKTSYESVPVSLKCNAPDDVTVHWKKNGRRVPDKNVSDGVLNLTVSEPVSVGNFTCHASNGSILDYKVVLLHETNLSLPERILLHREPIQCTVKNYSGNFSCSWKSEDSNTEFIFKVFRGENAISCDEPVKENYAYTVHCRDYQSCSSAEEIHSITAELHVIQAEKKKYEYAQATFLLREITKPDPPQEVKVHTKSHHNHSVQWKYPETWCYLHSFFPLLFKVAVEENGSGPTEHETELTYLPLHHKHIKKACVQARDLFFNSSWSEWSCSNYKKKPKRKGSKKQKDENKKNNQNKKKKKKKDKAI
ncbi:interleukin-12 subunit beta [Hyperolius riggenbachi]|uniref:interleukin-12 subunit beta n=1 Tax=Hyperolius riggenbachi TaxID=752182 RepID=UPI0035A301AE